MTIIAMSVIAALISASQSTLSLSAFLVCRPAIPRALKKSPFFMTKTENAYDL